MNNFYWFISYEPVTKIYHITNYGATDIFGSFYELVDAERLMKEHNNTINKIQKNNTDDFERSQKIINSFPDNSDLSLFKREY